MHLTEYSRFALALAKAAGEVLKKYWGNLHDICDKEIVGDLVTEADKESERCILSMIKAHYPHHAVLAEESGSHEVAQADFLWVIDPLDGTINYAHQYPLVSISIALVFKGKPIVGVVYNPIQEELFQAVDGQGVTLNGKPIHVSTTQNLPQSLLVSGFAYDRRQNKDNNYAEFCHLTDLTLGVRRGGSAALDMAYVAAGRCDGYWERGIKAWDVAAGILLVQEAGGKVSTYDGAPYVLSGDKILATNGKLHQTISDELIKVAKVR